jgi:hypothetical protein
MQTPLEAYGPDTIALMGRVFDTATAALKSAGISVPDALKSVMAHRILRAIAKGERDIDRLMQHAIEAADASRSPAQRRRPSPTRVA